MDETIYYDKARCKYFVKRDTNRYLSSVTDIIGRYIFHFTEEHLQKAAEKRAKLLKKTAAEVREMWAELHTASVDKGNEFHNGISDTFTLNNEPGTGVVEYTYKNPYLLPDGTYNELRIFSTKFLVAARMDRVKLYTIGSTRYADIIDYKTGLLYDSKYNDYGDPYRMKYFMRTLPDSPVGKAIAQINCYAYLLQLHGFKVNCMNIYHSRDILESPASQLLKLTSQGEMDGPNVFDIYECPYLSKETYLLFSNNRNDNYECQETKDAQNSEFAEIWSR